MEPPTAAARPVEHQEPELGDLKRPPTDDNLDFVALVIANVSLFGKHARLKTRTAAKRKQGQRGRGPPRDDSDYGNDDHFRLGALSIRFILDLVGFLSRRCLFVSEVVNWIKEEPRDITPRQTHTARHRRLRAATPADDQSERAPRGACAEGPK